MKVGTDKGKRYRPYKRMSDEEKENFIFIIYQKIKMQMLYLISI